MGFWPDFASVFPPLGPRGGVRCRDVIELPRATCSARINRDPPHWSSGKCLCTSCEQIQPPVRETTSQ